MDQAGHRGDEDQQEHSMEEIGEAGAGAVVDIRPATDDFGDHGQAADERGDRIADPDGEHVAIEIGLALPRVE